jgi:hypothetical protein
VTGWKAGDDGEPEHEVGERAVGLGVEHDPGEPDLLAAGQGKLCSGDGEGRELVGSELSVTFAAGVVGAAR